MKKKTVEYSYPSSPNANRFGYPRGCYTVSAGNEPIAAFSDRDAAVKFALALPYPWTDSFLRFHSDWLPEGK